MMFMSTAEFEVFQFTVHPLLSNKYMYDKYSTLHDEYFKYVLLTYKEYWPT